MKSKLKLAIGIVIAATLIYFGLVKAWPILEVRYSSKAHVESRLSELNDTPNDAVFALECLNSQDTKIIWSALSGLTQLNSETSKGIAIKRGGSKIRSFLIHKFPTNRYLALEACAHLGLLTKQDMDTALGDTDQYVRMTACDIAIRYRVECSSEGLWKIAQNDSYGSAVRATQLLASQSVQNLLTLATEEGHKPDRDFMVAAILSLLSDEDYLMMISNHRTWVKSEAAAVACARSLGGKGYLLPKSKAFLQEIVRPYPQAQSVFKEELDFIRRNPNIVESIRLKNANKQK